MSTPIYYFFWVSLRLVPEFTHPRVLVHIYYTHNGATVRERCLCRLGLIQSTCDPTHLWLPHLISVIIIPYSVDFVNTFLIFFKNFWEERSLVCRRVIPKVPLVCRRLMPNLCLPLSVIIISYLPAKCNRQIAQISGSDQLKICANYLLTNWQRYGIMVNSAREGHSRAAKNKKSRLKACSLIDWQLPTSVFT